MKSHFDMWERDKEKYNRNYTINVISDFVFFIFFITFPDFQTPESNHGNLNVTTYTRFVLNESSLPLWFWKNHATVTIIFKERLTWHERCATSNGCTLALPDTYLKQIHIWGYSQCNPSYRRRSVDKNQSTNISYTLHRAFHRYMLISVSLLSVMNQKMSNISRNAI